MQVLHSQVIHVKYVQMVTGPLLDDQLHAVMHVEQDTIVQEVFDQDVVQANGRAVLCFLQIQSAHNV